MTLQQALQVQVHIKHTIQAGLMQTLQIFCVLLMMADMFIVYHTQIHINMYYVTIHKVHSHHRAVILIWIMLQLTQIL